MRRSTFRSQLSRQTARINRLQPQNDPFRASGSAVTEHDGERSGRSPNRRVTINEDGHHHLLSAIYDLASAPTDWPIVLRLLAEGLNVPTHRRSSQHRNGTRPVPSAAVGITADDHRAFLRPGTKTTCSGARRPARQAGAIVLGRSILPKSALLRTAMYRHYLAPRGSKKLARLDIFSDRPSQPVDRACPALGVGPRSPQ